MPSANPIQTPSDAADLAQVIIAIANIMLAIFLFLRQVIKDGDDIKLNWFKELVIQPNIDEIKNYFIALHKIQDTIVPSPIDDAERQEIENTLWSERDKINRSFITVLNGIDPKFADNCRDEITKVTKEIIKVLINRNELKINEIKNYENYIGEKIKDLHSYIIASIYKYKGTRRRFLHWLIIFLFVVGLIIIGNKGLHLLRFLLNYY